MQNYYAHDEYVIRILKEVVPGEWVRSTDADFHWYTLLSDNKSGLVVYFTIQWDKVYIWDGTKWTACGCDLANHEAFNKLLIDVIISQLPADDGQFLSR